MTVVKQYSYVELTATGDGKNFPFDFETFPDSELIKIYLVDTAGTITEITSNYTLTFTNEGEDGGLVVYPTVGSPIAAGNKIRIMRVLPLTQDLDIELQGGFNPTAVEDQLDRTTQQIQQLNDRTPQPSDGEILNPLPASSLLGRGSSGSGGTQRLSLAAALTLTGTILGLATGGVQNSHLANMAALTMKGSVSGGAPQDLTAAEVRDDILSVYTKARIDSMLSSLTISTVGGVGIYADTLIADDQSEAVNNATKLEGFKAAALALKVPLITPNSVGSEVYYLDDHDADNLAFAIEDELVIQGTNTKFKLADASNCHLFGCVDASDWHVQRIDLDGNKSNQSTGSSNPWRGMYILGECYRWVVSYSYVHHTVDHGIMTSDGGDPLVEAGRNALIFNTEVSHCGSSAHTSGGGPGGTGIGAGHFTQMILHCHSHDNYLNGAKTANGMVAFCHFHDNGGGCETGFATPEYEFGSFLYNVIHDNTGDGIRNQGQGDKLKIIGNIIYNNGAAGITLLQAVKGAFVSQNYILNNGQDPVTFPRSATTGLDGISILSSSVGGEYIVITQNYIGDNQGSPTQEYCVYVENDYRFVRLGSDNVFNGAKTQALWLTLDGDEPFYCGNIPGLSGCVKDMTQVTAPADTSNNLLKALVIKHHEVTNGSEFQIDFSGGVTNAANTVTIRIDVNGSAFVVSSQAAGDSDPYAVRITLKRHNSTVWWVNADILENGGTNAKSSLRVSIGGSTDITVGLYAQKTDASDTVTYDYLESKVVN